MIGLVLALMKYSGHPLLYWPSAVYIEFFRTTPPLVQIIWLYYGLPLLTGYDLGAFGAAAVALGLNIGASTRRSSCRYCRRPPHAVAGRPGAWPQFHRHIAVRDPAAGVAQCSAADGTTTIYLIKDTALAPRSGRPNCCGSDNLSRSRLSGRSRRSTIVAILYFVVTYPVALLVEWMERRFKVARA